MTDDHASAQPRLELVHAQKNQRMIDRRGVLAGGSAAAVLGSGGAFAAALPPGAYGMIGKIMARPGQGAALASLLLEGSSAMPGCLSYVVAADQSGPDLLWVSEAWTSKASHAASLSSPGVRAAIARARPLIERFETMAEVRPLGGVGLGEAARQR